jgi:hypothetical protein
MGSMHSSTRPDNACIEVGEGLVISRLEALELDEVLAAQFIVNPSSRHDVR